MNNQTENTMNEQKFKIEDGVQLKKPSAGRYCIAPYNQALCDMKPGQSIYPLNFSQYANALRFCRMNNIAVTGRKVDGAYRVFKLEAK